MNGEALDVTIITGMSGAGRSEAAHVLEDLGFFVIDNLPPMLIGKVAELARGHETPARYALVVDVRSGDFLQDLSAAVDELHRHGVTTRILYLDAADDVLVRRYEESRRRHPMSDTDRVSDGIVRERILLEPLVAEADLRIDTSTLNVHELRDRLRELFSQQGADSTLQINVVTFGYKHGLPLDVDLVFDCRFLPNPHWIEELRPLTGLDAPVRDYVLAQPGTREFLDELDRLFGLLVPGYEREGKSYLSVALGCTGGRHRSVVIGEQLGQRFRRLGHRTAVHHRDVKRAGQRPLKVVALGGGHGLALTLQAVRRYAGSITAVVSVADDGGSSGRLRRDLGVAAPGDLRKCLVALASGDGPWPAALEHRFKSGELSGHPLGNLMLVGLAESLGNLTDALDEIGRLLGAVGRVVPATIDPVSVMADIGGRSVIGQVAVESMARSATVRRVELLPASPPATPAALAAIAAADQIVLAPGSLYTSVLAVLCVPEIRQAIAAAPGRVVNVCNLQTDAETAGLDGTDHLRIVLDHGGRVDTLLHDPVAGLAVSETAVRELGVTPRAASIAVDNAHGHDPARLAAALAALL